MGGVIGGIVLVVLGFVLVYKTDWFLQNFGRIPSFDKWLHTFGGSRLAYKVFGILFVFFGILAMTGLLDNFLNWSLGSIFKRSGMMQ